MSYTLPQLLKSLVDQGGSDLHISENSPPRLRIDGLLYPLDVSPLTNADTIKLCYSVLTEDQKKYFEENFEIDLAFTVNGLARFRANIFYQKGSVAGAFRIIPLKVMTLKELNLPVIVENLCSRPRGLILVTGPTGSGKSTTLAAMIDFINQTRSDHIVTIEDPIEFQHQSKMSLVNQREVGPDTKAFSNALKSALRQDPDVILVGEMRDLETISLALTAAETGHLVFATLHTNSCVASLNRIIDAFPADRQSQIRAQLAFSLQATFSQALLPAQGGGRCLALEIMIPNSGIRNLIRDDKFHQIYSAMQTGQDKSGMQTFNQSLVDLVEQKKLGVYDALDISGERQELEMLLANKLGIKVSSIVGKK
ncbi:MAG: type IV pilus twitching motility protein PilT [Proteobacteria bacterium]|nr:type IV pilus twitching motility protein PilT [Pseudomonadota bacterium]